MEAPKHYSERIRTIGGINAFGEPRFILHWGADPIVRPGLSSVRLAPFLAHCWCLCEWRPPEEFGLPEDWDGEILGDFPNRGAYIVRQIFRYGNKPDSLDCSTLNLNVLEMMIRNCLEHEDDSLIERRLLIEKEKAKEEAAEVSKIADILEDASPRFKGPMSYRGQVNRHSAVQQKEEQIERLLRWRNAYRLQLNKGLSVS